MKQFRSMTYPYVAWISVMIVLPMLLIVLYAFTVSGNEVLTFQFTFDNFVVGAPSRSSIWLRIFAQT